MTEQTNTLATEIPEDIREASDAVFEYWMKTADTVISELIARALLAEREATAARVREECARVAEDEALCVCDDDYDLGGSDMSKRIAAAIREGSR